MTKFQLFQSLVCPCGQYTTIKGITGIVQCIAREDGSGCSFNVVMCLANNRQVTVHVRTVD
jgi:hypothetical protein